MSNAASSSPTERSQNTSRSPPISEIPTGGKQAYEQPHPLASEAGMAYTQARPDIPWSTQQFPTDSTDMFSQHPMQPVLTNFNTQGHDGHGHISMGIQLDYGGVSGDDTLMMDESSGSLSQNQNPYMSPGYLSGPAHPVNASLLQTTLAQTYGVDTRSDYAHQAESDPPNLANEQSFPKTAKTVITIENLDPATRAEILNLLCKRKLVTTIEVI